MNQRPPAGKRRHAQSPSLSPQAEAERKRKADLQELKRKQQNPTPTTGPAKAGGGERSAQTAARTPAKSTEIKQETREDRLAELSRQQRVMGGDTEVKPGVPKQHESQIAPSEEAIASVLPPEEPVNVFAPKSRGKNLVNKPGAKQAPRRFRRREKKGGGRQPQIRKLNRRKYLEYKYEVRRMLDDPAIAEENRSNLLGQIWAKGERIGVEAAVEFINDKEAETIIPEHVAEMLRTLVRSYTTKR